MTKVWPDPNREGRIWLACYRMRNIPRTQNGREMAGEMERGFQNGRRMQIAKFKLSVHLVAVLGPILVGGCQPFPSHFLFWAHFPFCGRPAKSQDSRGKSLGHSVGTGSCESLFCEFGSFFLENTGNSVLNFGSLKILPPNRHGPSSYSCTISLEMICS